MKHSFTYHITMLVLKLKGIKKDFSQDPIDYKKIRKGDVVKPKGRLGREYLSSSFKISNSSISEFRADGEIDKLTIFIHGGAFISGPAAHHWDTIQSIVSETNQCVWMCNYPKAPEHTISEISDNLDEVYRVACEKYKASDISLIGDSVGGTLITALVQRLVAKNLGLPGEIVLVSPVMDASMSNPKIEAINDIDPMLSKAGVLSAKKLCAENGDLKNQKISPLNGSFENFPPTMIFVADHDITYPDQLLAIEKMKNAGVKLEVIEGKGMPHIWPFLPVMKEAKVALSKILKRLKG